ncbi:putative cytokinesis regulator [Golovinomyces cichoracearum]|uniref:Putative cytokinesis regulator n=1 Tax=Golovinomyces cichoracearum TaxID=62708 RepID=A0A420I930_9PEZI|nr:putative cytokinesis regulator [Golovinomyces cichoracearum]
MIQSILRSQKVIATEPIESWDDDDLDIEGDDFAFRSTSLTTNLTTTLSNLRDSMSSRLSVRSDVDSNHGYEEKQVNVHGDDEDSTNIAIASAKRVGIPIPQNVPASALVGGTIKRLGSKKAKKMIQDDWDDGDLDFSDEVKLNIKRYNAPSFPEALRQLSEKNAVPDKPLRLQKTASSPCQCPQIGPNSNIQSNFILDRYKYDEEDDFDNIQTIKVSKNNQIPKLLTFTAPSKTQRIPQSTDLEDFEKDFQLPPNNEPLKLSLRKDFPKTPNSIQDEYDEWGEGGSLGTRNGGKRDRASIRSSSTTAMSPSISSSLTVESEDEGLDGLLLPNGPIDFDEILKQKQLDQTFSHNSEHKLRASRSKEDFLSGLEIGFGDVFDSNKLTINRNVKVKTKREASPTRPKAAVSLTFTNKSSIPSTSRLPRPLGSYERLPSSLEPVSESGDPIVTRHRRSHSRLGCHSTHTSVTNITTTSTSSNVSLPPSTPRQRELLSKPSVANLRKESAKGAPILKLKRSMPIIRTLQMTNKNSISRHDRHPSNIDSGRTNATSRPKTPVERGRGVESDQHTNRVSHYQMPFLPAGVSNAQSHHVLTKNLHHIRRHDSESSNNSLDCRSSSRAVSRSTIRSRSPRRKGADSLSREATTKRILTKPVRHRNFGDGCELDVFDDLPTSRESEQKFIKETASRGPLRSYSCRKKVDQETRTSCSNTSTSLTPIRSRDDLPRFARDTMASRLARENTLAQRISSNQGAPSSAFTNHWKAKIAASTSLTSINNRSSKSCKNKSNYQKPQLIKQLGNHNKPKSVKGMYYNPHIYRWEGNDCDISHFDAPSSPSVDSVPSLAYKDNHQSYREKETLTPRPALIQHVKSVHNVQVVGGMVFDPHRMCWLKISSQRRRDLNSSDDAANSVDSFNDEEDVFKDVPDLEENRPRESSLSGFKSDDHKEDFVVGEEFDVGPEFVKRQREEEERWKRKVEVWIQAELGVDRNIKDWRWNVRDMVMNHEV